MEEVGGFGLREVVLEVDDEGVGGEDVGFEVMLGTGGGVGGGHELEGGSVGGRAVGGFGRENYFGGGDLGEVEFGGDVLPGEEGEGEEGEEHCEGWEGESGGLGVGLRDGRERSHGGLEFAVGTCEERRGGRGVSIGLREMNLRSCNVVTARILDCRSYFLVSHYLRCHDIPCSACILTGQFLSAWVLSKPGCVV